MCVCVSDYNHVDALLIMVMLCVCVKERVCIYLHVCVCESNCSKGMRS